MTNTPIGLPAAPAQTVNARDYKAASDIATLSWDESPNWTGCTRFFGPDRRIQLLCVCDRQKLPVPTWSL